MKQNGPFSNRTATCSSSCLACRTPIRRGAILIITAGVLAACAHDVAVQNPQTGTAEVCHASPGGFNPWSQTTGCVADHVTQGWTISSQE